MPPQPSPNRDAMIRALIRANRQMSEANRQLVEAVESAIGPAATAGFQWVPNDLQARLLSLLKGKSLRVDSLVNQSQCSKRDFYRNPGGIPELEERGLVDHHRRVGYWSTEFPPDDLPKELK